MTIPRQYSTLQSRGRFNGEDKGKDSTRTFTLFKHLAAADVDTQNSETKEHGRGRLPNENHIKNPKSHARTPRGTEASCARREATTTTPIIRRRTFLSNYDVYTSTLRRRTKVSTAGEEGTIGRLHPPVDSICYALSRHTPKNAFKCYAVTKNIYHSNVHSTPRYAGANLHTKSTSRLCHSVDGGSVEKIVAAYALPKQDSTATSAV